MRQKKVKYTSLSSGIVSKKDAQRYGLELNRIKTEYGELNVKNIVKEAKDKRNPLHDFFEWDNSVAGEKWREQQARMLVSSITEIVVIEGKSSEHRAFYSIKRGSKNGYGKYVSLSEVINTKSYRDEILDGATSHLENLLRFLKLLKKTK